MLLLHKTVLIFQQTIVVIEVVIFFPIQYWKIYNRLLIQKNIRGLLIIEIFHLGYASSMEKDY